MLYNVGFHWTTWISYKYKHAPSSWASLPPIPPSRSSQSAEPSSPCYVAASYCAVLCLAAQSCPTICNPMDCSPPGSSVHGNSPGKNTGMGCHGILQGIFLTQGLNPGIPHCRQILYTLSHQGSPRILEWVAYPFSRVTSQPRNSYLFLFTVVVYVSMLLSPFVPLSPSPSVSTSACSMAVSLLLPCKYLHLHYFSRFYIYALICDICFSDLLHCTMGDFIFIMLYNYNMRRFREHVYY